MKHRSGSSVIVGRGDSAKAYVDLKQPNGDRFRIFSKSVADEAKRRASKVIRDTSSGRYLDSKGK